MGKVYPLPTIRLFQVLLSQSIITVDNKSFSLINQPTFTGIDGALNRRLKRTCPHAGVRPAEKGPSQRPSDK
jgi:hypothetical protein